MEGSASVPSVSPLEWIQACLQGKERCIVAIQHPRMRIMGSFERRTSDDLPFISFLKIPYARPPIGPLRFQPPQPLLQTSKPKRLIAETKADPCLQLGQDGKAIGSENCLFLNVFIPTRPGNNPVLLPVIVYIHGGGFCRSSIEHVVPEGLVRQNLVCVTLHYRLGVFGFLNMHTENCRGNAGLKDIVMALQWIQNNIVHFGGDPNKVTIFGHSSGGSAVNLLMVSPLSRGLFHKAIVQAGGIHCPWGYGGHGRSVRKLFKRYGQMNNELTSVVVESMIREDAVKLLEFCNELDAEQVEVEPKRMSVFLRPSVECIMEGAFLPTKVEDLMLNAKPVPTIAGITEKEGYMFFRANPERNFVSMVRDIKEFQDLLKQNSQWSNRSVEELSETVRQAYFPGLDDMNAEEIKQNLATLITDLYHRRFYDNFEFGNQKRPRCAPFYIYHFDYFTGVPLNPLEKRVVEGVAEEVIQRNAAEHGDDVQFILCPDWIMKSILRLPPDDIEKARKEASNVTQNMCELWGSFCETGKPRSLLESKKWLRHTKKRPRYLHITDSLTMVNGWLHKERWRELNDIFGEASVIPSLAGTPAVSRRNSISIQMEAMSIAGRSSDETSSSSPHHDE